MAAAPSSSGEGGEQRLGTVIVPRAPDGQRQRGRRCPLLRLGEALSLKLPGPPSSARPTTRPLAESNSWQLPPHRSPFHAAAVGHHPKGVPGTAAGTPGAAQVSRGFVSPNPDLEEKVACDKPQSPHGPQMGWETQPTAHLQEQRPAPSPLGGIGLPPPRPAQIREGQPPRAWQVFARRTGDTKRPPAGCKLCPGRRVFPQQMKPGNAGTPLHKHGPFSEQRSLIPLYSMDLLFIGSATLISQ